ncbi:hypothetical protein [Flintibacter muris]|uniref:hypothetical protein n=1 Tax=Flintibacter muris TaxID=2941327 RepID=UPI0020425C39|nr:hypothetical protein [Flintibacter muris]
MNERLIGIDQFPVPINVINKETAGHSRSDLFYNRESLLTEGQRTPLVPLLFLHKAHRSLLPFINDIIYPVQKTRPLSVDYFYFITARLEIQGNIGNHYYKYKHEQEDTKKATIKKSCFPKKKKAAK